MIEIFINEFSECYYYEFGERASHIFYIEEQIIALMMGWA